MLTFEALGNSYTVAWGIGSRVDAERWGRKEGYVLASLRGLGKYEVKDLRAEGDSRHAKAARGEVGLCGRAIPEQEIRGWERKGSTRTRPLSSWKR